MSAILKLTYCDKKKKVEVSPHLSTQIVQGMLWWVIIKAEVIYLFLPSVEIYFMEQKGTLSQCLKSKRMNLVKDYNSSSLVLYKISKYVYFSFPLPYFKIEVKQKSLS